MLLVFQREGGSRSFMHEIVLALLLLVFSLCSWHWLMALVLPPPPCNETVPFGCDVGRGKIRTSLRNDACLPHVSLWSNGTPV